jgi:transportin-1
VNATTARTLIARRFASLGSNISSLVERENLLSLLERCAQDPMAEVRQSSFALLGDLTKACFRHVRPHLHVFLPLLTQNLDPNHVSVCNNAIWTIGEIAVKTGSDIQPFVSITLGALIVIINRTNTPKTLLENTAITLGRLALVCSTDVATQLPRFVHSWCTVLQTIRDNDEKDSAFRGVCNLIMLNPSAVANELIVVCDAIALWERPPADLQEKFRNILHMYKLNVGDEQWNHLTGRYNSSVRQRLQVYYGV